MSCLKIKNNLAFLMNIMKYTVKISRLISQRNKSLSRNKNLRKKNIQITNTREKMLHL